MGLFDKKDPMCIECGKKTNVLNRTVLRDNTCLCGNCAKIIPFELHDNAKKYWDSSNWGMVKDWLTNVQAEYHAKFKETHKYYEIHLDAVNGLFYFGGKKLKPENTIYNIKDTTFYCFFFVPEEVKEKLFSTVAKGKTKMAFAQKNPTMTVNHELCLYAEADVEQQGILLKKMVYKNPYDLEKFEDAFENVYVTRSEYIEKLSEEMPVGIMDLAMEKYLITDWEKVSLLDLKYMRNYLIENHKASDPESLELLSFYYIILKKEKLKNG